MLKFLLVLTIVAAVAQGDHPDMKVCLEESGVTFEEVKNYQSGVDPVNEKIWCFFKCRMEKSGILLEDGTFTGPGKLAENLKFLNGTEDELKSARECLGKVPVVKECKDMEEAEKCFAGLKMSRHH